jgi:ABC-type sugar transport system ATPase subunit
MGAGRSELLMSIFGAHLGKRRAKFSSKAKKVSISIPSEAIKNGIGFVTEDRKRFGLILDQTILDNMTLAGLKQISGAFSRIARAKRSRRENQ